MILMIMCVAYILFKTDY